MAELQHLLVTRLDRLGERLDSIAVTMERNTTSLEHHVERTNQLEKYVDHLDNRVRPLEADHAKWLGALKVFSVSSTVCAGLFAILKLLGKI